MPRSRYQNCFYYFRGPSAKQATAELDKQIEDNTTKALINVLENSGTHVTSSFLATVLDCKDVGSTLKCEYFLQGPPDTPAHLRLLLGLSNRGKIDESSWMSSVEGSRVDASIHLAGILTVFIESKVVSDLNGAQLQRHATACGIPLATADNSKWMPPPEWRIRTWVDVYEWAQKEIGITEKQPDRFLLGQLVEYLQLAGLAPTWTLRAEHFDYFGKPAEEREGAVAAEIRTRLTSIWGAVEKEMGEKLFQDVLGEVRVGNLGQGANHAWAQSNADASFDLPNLTIEMEQNQLNLCIVGGFDRQAACLERWLSLTEQAELASMTDLELAVFRRTARGGHHGKKIVWQGAAWEKIDMKRLCELTPATLKTCLAEWRKPLDNKTQRLGFHIRKAWNRADVIDKKDFPAKLAASIEGLLPTLDAIRKA